MSSSLTPIHPLAKETPTSPTFPQRQLPSNCWVTHSLVPGALGSRTSISNQVSLLSPARCHHLSSVSQPWVESMAQPCRAPSKVGLDGYRILWKVEIWKARAGLLWVLAEINTPHHCDPVSPTSVPPRASLPLIFLEDRVSCFLPFPSPPPPPPPPSQETASPSVAQAVLKLNLVRLQLPERSNYL